MTNIQIARDEVRKARIAYNNAQRSGDPGAIKNAEGALNNAQSTLDSFVGLGQVDPNAKEALNTVKKHIETADKKGVQAVGPSRSFYRGLIGSITGKPTGNENDIKAQKARTASDNYKQSSAEHGAEAKQHQQIANRNEFSEAGKIASVQNDAQNRQTINNTSYAAGNAAALQRQTNAPDVVGQREYQSQQRTQAEQQRAAGMNDRQMAGATANDAMQYDIASRDYNDELNISNSLSNAVGNSDQINNQTVNQNSVQTPEQPEAKPNVQNWQANTRLAMNYLTYPDKYPDGAKELQTMQANGLISNVPNPVPQNWVSQYGDAAPQKYSESGQDPAFTEVYNMLITKSGRANSDGSQKNVGVNGYTSNEYDNNAKLVGQTENTGSDERIKNIQSLISNSLMSGLKNNLNGLNEHDVRLFASLNKDRFKHNDQEYDMNQEGDYGEDVLDAYADYMVNYLYNYKPEAKSIDPSIDPNEEHIGPMAQDIEKINPACIKETPDGTKTVDTSRLALMNAGVIGDLARELRELKEVFLGK